MKYIQYRVRLKDDVDINSEDVVDIAGTIQDMIIDWTGEEEAPPIFTQDVTYSIEDK